MRLRDYGFEWRSSFELFGVPFIHIAFGRDGKNGGRLRVAKGIIAIGQVAFGVVTVAQFGVGLLFGFGQFMAGWVAVAQFALGVRFGLGQFATGKTAIGQAAVGQYTLGQIGYGEHVWSQKRKDPEAVSYFENLRETAEHRLQVFFKKV